MDENSGSRRAKRAYARNAARVRVRLLRRFRRTFMKTPRNLRAFSARV